MNPQKRVYLLYPSKNMIRLKDFFCISFRNNVHVTNNSENNYVTDPGLSCPYCLLRHEVSITDLSLEMYCFATVLMTHLWSGLVMKEESFNQRKMLK